MELLRVDDVETSSRNEPLAEIEISHVTRYEFSRPVSLEPHLLRFQPRADGAQLPLMFRLDVDPAPMGQAACLDAAGNVATQVWFEGLHTKLAIAAHTIAEVRRENPFDYLPDGAQTRLPVFYRDDADSLRPYLKREPPASGVADDVAVFAARMRAAARAELLPFLTSVTHTMFERLELVRREEGPAWAPVKTWREGCGACRDLAALFIDVCRAAGVAARFVSGYEHLASPPEFMDLHAWAEVYVPGGGWRGYDPSRGLAVAQRHVAVAASATAAGAAPVVGTFRGTGVASTIVSEVHVERRTPELASSGSVA